MAAKKPKIITVTKLPSLDQPGYLRPIGGSNSDDFCDTLVKQVCATLWLAQADPEREIQITASLAAMRGLAPQDELEGMLVGQLIACHNAAMECYRRAMLNGQTFEGRRENLNQATKLTRSYAALVEALDRHRRQGEQYVRVEHVHVHEGGQAIVGTVTGSSGHTEEDQSRAPAITHKPGIPMRSPDAERDTVPIAAGER